MGEKRGEETEDGGGRRKEKGDIDDADSKRKRRMPSSATMIFVCMLLQAAGSLCNIAIVLDKVAISPWGKQKQNKHFNALLFFYLACTFSFFAKLQNSAQTSGAGQKAFWWGSHESLDSAKPWEGCSWWCMAVHVGAYLLKKDLNSAGAGVEDREYVHIKHGIQSCLL